MPSFTVTFSYGHDQYKSLGKILEAQGVTAFEMLHPGKRSGTQTIKLTQAITIQHCPIYRRADPITTRIAAAN